MKTRLLNLAVMAFALAPSGLWGASAIGVIDAGGRRAASASCTLDASLGAIGGLAANASLTRTLKPGYIGQLTEVTNLAITATPSPVAEDTLCQLGGLVGLDDGTVTIIPGSDMTWAPPGFPLAAISPAGAALAVAVYADTPAAIVGNYAGLHGTASFAVKDTNPDNFGGYAGDGLPDSWQIQYFGLPPNPSAAPTADPSGVGQNNLFKYIAGLNPTNPASVFSFHIQPGGQAGQMQLLFSPCWPDRTYTPFWTTDPAGGAWSPLNGLSSSDNGPQRTLTDAAAEPAKFYRLQISKP